MRQDRFLRAFAGCLYKTSRLLPAFFLAGALFAAPCTANAGQPAVKTPQSAAATTAAAAQAKKKTPATAPKTKAKQANTAAKGQTPAPVGAASTPAITVKGFPISQALAVPPELAAKLPVADTWQPLMARLTGDGIENAYLQALFGRMGESYSHIPMGTKINELYANKYTPRPPRKPTGVTTPPVYKSLLAPAIVERCREYLLQHAVAFGAMEAAYGVPRETVAALLMVETRLGAFLGNNSALWSLACLAAADSPARISPTLQALEMTPERLVWVEKILQERSAWAYKELVALVRHSQANGLDPLVMPGSVYGAIGLCQFMPSNLPKFAVDGNKDGKIDLFDPADAIPSVANYLREHGWAKGDRDTQHKTLMRYNKSRVYANTILALGDAIAEPVNKAPAQTAKKEKNVTAATKKASAGSTQKTSGAKAPKSAKAAPGKKS